MATLPPKLMPFCPFRVNWLTVSLALGVKVVLTMLRIDTEGAEVVQPMTAFPLLSTTSDCAVTNPSTYTFWPVMFKVDVVVRDPELVMFTVLPERLMSPVVVMLPDTIKSPVLNTANLEKSMTESITIALV